MDLEQLERYWEAVKNEPKKQLLLGMILIIVFVICAFSYGYFNETGKNLANKINIKKSETKEQPKIIKKQGSNKKEKLTGNKSKEISDITSIEILNSVRNTDSPLAADNLAKTLYCGKYVEWTGKVNMILNEADSVDIYWDHGRAIFDYLKIPISLKERATITIYGKIKSVYDQREIELDQCELRKIH